MQRSCLQFEITLAIFCYQCCREFILPRKFFLAENSKKKKFLTKINNAYQTCDKSPFRKIRPLQKAAVETLAIFLELLDSSRTFQYGKAQIKQQERTIKNVISQNPSISN